MTRRTDVDDGCYSRRRRSVITVARGAGRRTQIAANSHRVMVNTLAVVGELSRFYAVGLHVIRVGVTATAGGGNLQRVHSGAGVTSGTDSMDAMAVGTDRDTGIALLKFLTVHAGAILS